jgi:DNA-binding MarR family transcriptional regulator
MAPERASGDPGVGRSQRPADNAHLRQFLRSSHIFNAAVRRIIDARDLAESRGFSLTPSQLQLLKLITAEGQRTVSDVGAFLGVTTPAATKCVDKLERLGLLTRTPSTSDRRATMLSSSRAGRRLVRDYESVKRSRLEPALEQFSPGEIDQLTDLLERFAVALFSREKPRGESCRCCAAYIDDDCSIGRLRGGCPFQQPPADRTGEVDVS